MPRRAGIFWRSLHPLCRAGLAESGYRPPPAAGAVRAAGRPGLRLGDHLGIARQSRPLFLSAPRRPRGAAQAVRGRRQKGRGLRLCLARPAELSRREGRRRPPTGALNSPSLRAERSNLPPVMLLSGDCFVAALLAMTI